MLWFPSACPNIGTGRAIRTSCIMCVTAGLLFVVHHLLFSANGSMHTSKLMCNQFSYTSQAHDMRKHLHSTAVMTRKKCNYCINHSKYDTKISSCGCRLIITYNVRGSHTNCFECNQIFIFACFSSIHFEPFCLSLDEARAKKKQKKNQHPIVNVWINLLCVHV